MNGSSPTIVAIALAIFIIVILFHTQHSGVNAGKKKIWKNLKQIMALERGLPWKQDDPTCKKFCSAVFSVERMQMIHI